MKQFVKSSLPNRKKSDKFLEHESKDQYVKA